MGAKGKELAGPILGIIGSTMLLAGAVTNALAWGFGGILLIMLLTSLILGVMGLIGAILGFTGKRVAGAVLMLIAGIVASIGIFIPLGTVAVPPFLVLVSLTGAFLFVDPFLVLLGGILGLALKT